MSTADNEFGWIEDFLAPTHEEHITLTIGNAEDMRAEFVDVLDLIQAVDESLSKFGPEYDTRPSPSAIDFVLTQRTLVELDETHDDSGVSKLSGYQQAVKDAIAKVHPEDHEAITRYCHPDDQAILDALPRSSSLAQELYRLRQADRLAYLRDLDDVNAEQSRLLNAEFYMESDKAKAAELRERMSRFGATYENIVFPFWLEGKVMADAGDLQAPKDPYLVTCFSRAQQHAEVFWRLLFSTKEQEDELYSYVAIMFDLGGCLVKTSNHQTTPLDIAAGIRLMLRAITVQASEGSVFDLDGLTTRTKSFIVVFSDLTQSGIFPYVDQIVVRLGLALLRFARRWSGYDAQFEVNASQMLVNFSLLLPRARSVLLRHAILTTQQMERRTNEFIDARSLGMALLNIASSKIFELVLPYLNATSALQGIKQLSDSEVQQLHEAMEVLARAAQHLDRYGLSYQCEPLEMIARGLLGLDPTADGLEASGSDLLQGPLDYQCTKLFALASTSVHEEDWDLAASRFKRLHEKFEQLLRVDTLGWAVSMIYAGTLREWAWCGAVYVNLDQFDDSLLYLEANQARLLSLHFAKMLKQPQVQTAPGEVQYVSSVFANVMGTVDVTIPKIKQAARPGWPLVSINVFPKGTDITIIFATKPTNTTSPLSNMEQYHTTKLRIHEFDLSSVKAVNSRFHAGRESKEFALMDETFANLDAMIGVVLAKRLRDFLEKENCKFPDHFQIEGITLVLRGPLRGAPLLSAMWHENGVKRCLLDFYTVREMPGAFIAGGVFDRVQNAEGYISKKASSLLALAYPTAEWPDRRKRLHMSAKECISAASLFPGRNTLAFDHKARSQLLSTPPEDTTFILCSMHGTTKVTIRGSSGIKLVDKTFTATEIAKCRYKHLRCVFLTACDVGVAHLVHPDEPLTIQAAFLIAGAACVIGPCWRVFDFVAYVFSMRFMDYHVKGSFEPPEALRRSQLWLRDIENSEDYFNNDDFCKMHPDVKDIVEDFANAPETRTWCRGTFPFENPLFWACWTCTGA